MTVVTTEYIIIERTALFDFYTVDDLHEAKMRLVDDIDKLDVNTTGKHPHIPHRRDTICGEFDGL